MNDSQTFNVQFLIRHRNKKSPMTCIYMRITVNGQKVEVSTKLQCPVHLWDQSKERVKADGKFNTSRQIN